MESKITSFEIIVSVRVHSGILDFGFDFVTRDVFPLVYTVNLDVTLFLKVVWLRGVFNGE